MFRNLKSSEVKARFGQVGERGATVFLFVDAQTCEAILDETVGPLNWQREHPNGNPSDCIVSIYDEKKQMWIRKEDVGEVGEGDGAKSSASDSFKRACVNWGIARELYNVPFLWIPADKIQLKKKEVGGKTRYDCADKLTVKTAEFDGFQLKALEIVNERSKEVVYSYKKRGETKEKEARPAPAQAEKKGGEELLLKVEYELRRTGVSRRSLLNSYGVPELSLLTEEQAKDAYQRLLNLPSR